MLEIIQDWFLGLGRQYGVNPLVFGSIYVGAIPFFSLSVGWLVRNLRQEKPITLPALLSGLFFISAYLYLAIAGRNIPVWVWFFIALLVIFGVVSTVHNIRRRVREGDDAEGPNP